MGGELAASGPLLRIVVCGLQFADCGLQCCWQSQLLGTAPWKAQKVPATSASPTMKTIDTPLECAWRTPWPCQCVQWHSPAWKGTGKTGTAWNPTGWKSVGKGWQHW